MAFYQITLFYRSLKSEQAAVQAVQREIQLLAGKNFRVLSPGEQVCAIGFSTDKPREYLRSRFEGLGTETFSFLLTEVADMPYGWLSGDTWQWIANQIQSQK